MSVELRGMENRQCIPVLMSSVEPGASVKVPKVFT